MVPKSNSFHILLVEDIHFDREIFKEKFEKSNIDCKVTECSQAEDALELLRTDFTKFDIAVIDHTLPGITGLELCKKIIKEKIPTPIILLTGTGSEEIAVEAMHVGIEDYIIKGSISHGDMMPYLVKKVVEKYEDRLALKRAEEALRESEQRMSLHVQQTPLAVIEWNTAFEVTTWNPSAEKIFGYSKKESIGKKASEIIIPSSTKEHVIKIWQELLKQKGGMRSTNENITKEGRTILCEWYNTPLVDSIGNVIGVASIVQDITAQKEAEEATNRFAVTLQESNRLKDLFTDIMSHDLLNPAGVVRNASETLLDLESNDKKRAILELIRDSSSDLIETIKNASVLSKLETIEDLKCEVQDLNKILQATVNEFKSQLNVKKLRLDYLPNRVCPALVHPTVKDVFLNLVSNAIKYSPTGSIIEIDIEERSNYWIIYFKDFAEGIIDADKNKIFERFKRLEQRNIKGSGLGLAIVKRIVELHAGEVWVEDNPEGGSIFYVRLPKEEKRTNN